ncbi:MAG: DUF4190 domain-containing protein [Roseburia inulinivorans]
MNHYTKSIWVLTLGMAALVIAFLSPLFGILFGIAAIILGKKTMSEAKSKMAYAGFWIGIVCGCSWNSTLDHQCYLFVVKCEKRLTFP